MHDVRQKLTKCFPGVSPIRFRRSGVLGGGLERPAGFFWQLDAGAVVLTKTCMKG